MGSTTLVSVEEYLRTSYKPACEYIDGVLRQKPLPTRLHSRVQSRLVQAIGRDYPAYEALPELTVRLRTAEFLVPDVAVVLRDDADTAPYPEKPVFLCIEILSPDDRIGKTFAKCEEYHDWGVPHCWIIDPEKRRAWVYPKGGEPAEVTDRLPAGPLEISLADVWSN